jgi:hypothetical protein
MLIRSWPQGEEVVPAAPVIPSDEGESGWWGGALLSGARAALAVALTAAQLSASVANSFTTDSGAEHLALPPVDNFNDNSIDGTKWTATGSAPSAAREQNQRMELGGGILTGNSVFLNSVDYFDLAVGSWARLVVFGGAPYKTSMKFADLQGDYCFMGMIDTTGLLYFGVTGGGQGSVTYNPAVHAWWRVIVIAGFIHSQTAPSTAANPPGSGEWVDLDVRAVPGSLDTTQVQLTLEASSSSAGLSPAHLWDAVNTAESRLSLEDEAAAESVVRAPWVNVQGYRLASQNTEGDAGESPVQAPIDDFDDNSINTAIWGTQVGQVVEQRQMLIVGEGAGAFGASSLDSTVVYDLKLGSYVKLVKRAQLGRNYYAGLFVIDPQGQWVYTQVYGTQLIAAGTGVLGTNIPYVPATHGWLRLIEIAGVVHWQTAPADAQNPPAAGEWVDFYSLATEPTFDSTRTYSQLATQNDTADPVAEGSWFDGFNTRANDVIEDDPGIIPTRREPINGLAALAWRDEEAPPPPPTSYDSDAGWWVLPPVVAPVVALAPWGHDQPEVARLGVEDEANPNVPLRPVVITVTRAPDWGHDQPEVARLGVEDDSWFPGLTAPPTAPPPVVMRGGEDEDSIGGQVNEEDGWWIQTPIVSRVDRLSAWGHDQPELAILWLDDEAGYRPALTLQVIPAQPFLDDEADSIAGQVDEDGWWPLVPALGRSPVQLSLSLEDELPRAPAGADDDAAQPRLREIVDHRVVPAPWSYDQPELAILWLEDEANYSPALTQRVIPIQPVLDDEADSIGGGQVEEDGWYPERPVREQPPPPLAYRDGEDLPLAPAGADDDAAQPRLREIVDHRVVPAPWSYDQPELAILWLEDEADYRPALTQRVVPAQPILDDEADSLGGGQVEEDGWWPQTPVRNPVAVLESWSHDQRELAILGVVDEAGWGIPLRPVDTIVLRQPDWGHDQSELAILGIEEEGWYPGLIAPAPAAPPVVTLADEEGSIAGQIEEDAAGWPQGSESAPVAGPALWGYDQPELATLSIVDEVASTIPLGVVTAPVTRLSDWSYDQPELAILWLEDEASTIPIVAPSLWQVPLPWYDEAGEVAQLGVEDESTWPAAPPAASPPARPWEPVAEQLPVTPITIVDDDVGTGLLGLLSSDRVLPLAWAYWQEEFFTTLADDEGYWFPPVGVVAYRSWLPGPDEQLPVTPPTIVAEDTGFLPGKASLTAVARLEPWWWDQPEIAVLGIDDERGILPIPVLVFRGPTVFRDDDQFSLPSFGLIDEAWFPPLPECVVGAAVAYSIAEELWFSTPTIGVTEENWLPAVPPAPSHGARWLAFLSWGSDGEGLGIFKLISAEGFVLPFLSLTGSTLPLLAIEGGALPLFDLDGRHLPT